MWLLCIVWVCWHVAQAFVLLSLCPSVPVSYPTADLASLGFILHPPSSGRFARTAPGILQRLAVNSNSTTLPGAGFLLKRLFGKKKNQPNKIPLPAPNIFI